MVVCSPQKIQDVQSESLWAVNRIDDGFEGRKVFSHPVAGERNSRGVVGSEGAGNLPRGSS